MLDRKNRIFIILPLLYYIKQQVKKKRKKIEIEQLSSKKFLYKFKHIIVI